MKQFEVPNGYEIYRTINLTKDKKAAFIANALSIIIIIVLIILGSVIMRIFDLFNNIKIEPIDILLLLGATILYIVLHEAVHGICFRIFSGKWGNFGYKMIYFYAGSKAFYKKREYLIIGLAPIILFGILFLLLNILLPPSKFLFFYILQMINLSGAAGDIYVAFVIRKLPKEAIFRDHGVSFEIYLPKKETL